MALARELRALAADATAANSNISRLSPDDALALRATLMRQAKNKPKAKGKSIPGRTTSKVTKPSKPKAKSNPHPQRLLCTTCHSRRILKFLP